MGGMDMNNNGDGNGGDDPDVDQYFDDAGDIGYLPADHVTTQFSKWVLSILTFHSCRNKCLILFFIATHAKASKRLDQIIDWWAWKNRFAVEREGKNYFKLK